MFDSIPRTPLRWLLKVVWKLIFTSRGFSVWLLDISYFFNVTGVFTMIMVYLDLIFRNLLEFIFTYIFIFRNFFYIQRLLVFAEESIKGKNSRLQMLFKTGILKNFAISTGKHLRCTVNILIKCAPKNNYFQGCAT